MRSVFRDFQKCKKAAYRAAKAAAKTRNRVFFLKSLFRDFRKILKMIFDRIIHKQMFVAKRELNSGNSYDIMKSGGGVTSTAAANKSAARARGLTCSKTYFTRAILLCQPSSCNIG